MSPLRDPNMRASDADRERVADLLRRHCGDGRLTLEEFHARLDACFAAKTYGDLDSLVRDLPGPSAYDDLPVPASQRTGTSTALPSAAEPSRWRAVLASYLTTNIIVWVIYLASGMHGFPWPVFVTGPWGVALLGRAVAGSWDDDDDRARQRRIERQRRRELRR